MDFDASVRKAIYESTLETGAPPTIGHLTDLVEASDADMRAALSRLASARFVVLQPQSGELLMVPPFSAVPTPFVVQTPRYRAFANCAWDALGVPAMLGEPAAIEAACGCCGESMGLAASGHATPSGTGVVHFAVPARRWWDDIVFT